MDYKIEPYDTQESQVPPYELPDVLRNNDGDRVKNAWEWMNCRRDEVLAMFRKYEYGETLPRSDSMYFELLNYNDKALGGNAIRKEVRIHLEMRNGNKFAFDLLL